MDKIKDTWHFKATYMNGFVFLALAQILDMGMTYACLHVDSRFFELNPLMQGIVHSAAPLVAVKAIGIVVIAGLCELLRRTGYASVAHAGVWVAAGFSACVVWNNFMWILLILGYS